MKVALLISGYLRSFKDNISNIKTFINDRFEIVDLYIHITENELHNDKYLNINIKEDIIKNINNEFKVKSLIIESNEFFSEKNNDLYNTWAKYYKLNQIKILNEQNEGPYDIVIKIRPDIQLHNITFYNSDNIYIPENSLIDKNKLTNPYDPYICDIIAYGPSDKMNLYFNIYNHLKTLISLYGTISETLLYYYLNNNNISYILDNITYEVILSQCNIFAITGDSGSGKSTLGLLLKQYFSNSFLLECDRYHKWERSNEKWKEYTHLNPEANYISKMNEDIFNLKVKNEVYQVDYDHSTGTFKEPEKLENSDNIIVCGLHSLYGDINYIYDLSIYMDTDEDLKTQWKIERDTKKRGYTKEKILEQINKRKNDYKLYIEPQKEKSDIIVNFFLDNNIIKLRIFIDKKYDIKPILHIFNINKIQYHNNQVNQYNVLKFDSYIPNTLYNTLNNTSIEYFGFYNYILYIIINVRKLNLWQN